MLVRQLAAFSGEVSETCSSVREDVRDMLVCLVPGSRRKELERQDNPEDEASLAEVNVLEDSRRKTNSFRFWSQVWGNKACTESRRRTTNESAIQMRVQSRS